ncbi:hypothetical protein NUU61_002560 [Penicillium alfredii]|uniref:Small ribosomal subunit protein uS4m n=1 Tax=Penicillium alfredii TaxID=1506179 RepID=A0A9W9FRY2_9EURO|nr:uncharacterized protein NUU61_002560 [Penicillium alfredii]KAJ5105213.1 hypothetical protein NUU61_002560 [Penicillium alfredii]
MRNRASNSLSRGKIRQSWSKYNLFNLHRYRVPFNHNRSFFQQKWTAKATARAYHGEQVRESQWKRMFSHRIRSVIPMNPLHLAADDGSRASAGRGSGLEGDAKQPQITPYTQMAFAPLERRLDVAIFRAMFASSARQARQFVIHGAVTVNGQKMRHPSYLLNPGDLFQVDPERVMFATGAPKNKYERRESRQLKQKDAAEETVNPEAEEKVGKVEKADAKESSRDNLQALVVQAKSILSRGKNQLPAKRKQELRGFQKAVRRVLSRSDRSTILTDSLEAQFSELTLLLKTKQAEPKDSKAEKPVPRPSEVEENEAVPGEVEEEPFASDKLSEAFQQAAQGEEVDSSGLTKHETFALKRALAQMHDNPLDSTKPYATPWQPREYMSAFAFIPRYLEVNQNICAAVYLRHPVARPGLAEVPPPLATRSAPRPTAGT